MSPLLRRWALVLLGSLPLSAVLLGAFWLAGRFLPGLGSIKAAVGLAALLVGLLHAHWLIQAVYCAEFGEALASVRADGLLRLVPPEFVRVCFRLALAGLWLARSQALIAIFLGHMVGGGMRDQLLWNLSQLRLSVAKERAAHRGQLPAHLPGAPAAWAVKDGYGARLIPHAAGAEVELYGNEACRGSVNASLAVPSLRDSGHWGYVRDPKSACFGQVFIDCTHADLNGRLWASY